jgi:hypothetical protein
MLRTTTLSEIIKESPTSCCSLMSRRCAAQDRCDAASGWADFCYYHQEAACIPTPHRPRRCCAWRSTPSYVLFVTIIDGKLMSRGGCRRAALAQLPPRFLPSFRFFGSAGVARASKQSSFTRLKRQAEAHANIEIEQLFVAQGVAISSEIAMACSEAFIRRLTEMGAYRIARFSLVDSRRG